MTEKTEKLDSTVQTPGTVESIQRWHKRLTRKHIIRAIWVSSVLFVFWFVPYIPALKWDKVNVTRWERVRGKVQVDVGPKAPDWVLLKRVSRYAIYAVVSAEDGRFYTHNGLDFYQLRKSFELNMKKGRIVRGGSTITQQTVKMAFLGREKTLLRKARELVGTLLIELLLTKDEIMEWYLNLAEFGDAVYGIERASWHYFKTKPQLLSVEQAIHLALVLPSPNGWSKGLRRHSLTKFGHQRFRSILQTMRADGYITKAQQQQAMARGNFGSPINGYVTDVPEDPMDENIDRPTDSPDADPDKVFDQSSFRDEPGSSNATDGKKNVLEEAPTGSSTLDEAPKNAEEPAKNSSTEAPPADSESNRATESESDDTKNEGMAVPIEPRTDAQSHQTEED